MSARTQDPRRVDVDRACAQALLLSGQVPLAMLERLVDTRAGAGTDLVVDWSASFTLRPVTGGRPERRLRLAASARLPRECQRCLQPVLLPVEVDRSLLFVDDEATAAELDADADDDVLVASPRFDLVGLVEDELLLALPIVPRHDACPQPLATPASAAAAGPDDGRPHPFEALKALKRR